MARSAGAGVQLVAKNGATGNELALRRIAASFPCRATIGMVGNADHPNLDSWERPAAAARSAGAREFAANAMNPVDHPHGGGEGKSKGGRHPVTPWGVPTLGKRTRPQAQGIRQVDRPRPSPWQGKALTTHVQIIEEGAFHRRATAQSDRGDERPPQREANDPHLVAQLHRVPGHGRPHDRSPRRSQARARSSSASRWSVTSSASSHRRGTFRGHAGDKQDPGEEALMAATGYPNADPAVAHRGEVRPPVRAQGAGRSSITSVAEACPRPARS